MRACCGGAKSHFSGELELQARWFAGEFGREFEGTHGERVRILQFGIWNRAAGPDFTEAAVSVDDQPPQRGSIEIDPDVRDWERHGHAQNPNYENVVLHVFERDGGGIFFSRTASHRRIVQVRLASQQHSRALQDVLAHAGRCAPVLAEQSLEAIRETLLLSLGKQCVHCGITEDLTFDCISRADFLSSVANFSKFKPNSCVCL